jgi:geranylgeranyl diphosphate synthase, type II
MKAIEKALLKYLPKGRSVLHKAMRYSVLSGGKRIRPILAIEASRTCGGRIRDIMPCACAIELVHTYSLIHDDLPAMDDDDFRRGKPACHKVFGEAVAILAGDALLTLAFNIIAKHTRPEAGLNIVKELSDAVGCEGMVRGQAMDLEPHADEGKIKINLLKTARLFEAAAKTGALAAGARQREARALQRFGLYLGIAFQIIDDYLDGDGGSREGAELLMNKMTRELDIFGKKADRLNELAVRLLERRE